MFTDRKKKKLFCAWQMSDPPWASSLNPAGSPHECSSHTSSPQPQLPHRSTNAIKPPQRRCGKPTAMLPKHKMLYKRLTNTSLFRVRGTSMTMFVVASAFRHSLSWGKMLLAMKGKERMESARPLHAAAGGFNHRMKVKLFPLKLQCIIST